MWHGANLEEPSQGKPRPALHIWLPPSAATPQRLLRRNPLGMRDVPRALQRQQPRFARLRVPPQPHACRRHKGERGAPRTDKHPAALGQVRQGNPPIHHGFQSSIHRQTAEPDHSLRPSNQTGRTCGTCSAAASSRLPSSQRASWHRHHTAPHRSVRTAYQPWPGNAPQIKVSAAHAAARAMATAAVSGPRAASGAASGPKHSGAAGSAGYQPVHQDDENEGSADEGQTGDDIAAAFATPNLALSTDSG
ncbi:hypothetical protein ACCO45_000875 [Purpureocillium lilacinum]|uniref:Uncharacterized protein n=1 Tax=Purpureocillium lilacinum TaxID=33203 RepID=A0ACC4E5E8_PURLI